MGEDAFVRKSELEAIKEMIHAMDKRQTLLERDLNNATTAFQTIISKLETLPEKITQQVGQTIASEIERHKTSCRLEDLNKGKEKNNADGTVMALIARNLTNILLLLVLIAAAYLGVKVPF